MIPPTQSAKPQEAKMRHQQIRRAESIRKRKLRERTGRAKLLRRATRWHGVTPFRANGGRMRRGWTPPCLPTTPATGIPGIIAASMMLLGLGKYRRRRNSRIFLTKPQNFFLIRAAASAGLPCSCARAAGGGGDSVRVVRLGPRSPRPEPHRPHFVPRRPDAVTPAKRRITP
jgi:hypothetical protein